MLLRGLFLQIYIHKLKHVVIIYRFLVCDLHFCQVIISPLFLKHYSGTVLVCLEENTVHINQNTNTLAKRIVDDDG